MFDRLLEFREDHIRISSASSTRQAVTALRGITFSYILVTLLNSSIY
jgi:hypothetical protein